jgi:hypothetical protein
LAVGMLARGKLSRPRRYDVMWPGAALKAALWACGRSGGNSMVSRRIAAGRISGSVAVGGEEAQGGGILPGRRPV